MRPSPTAKHLLATLIFVGVSLVCGYMAFYEDYATAEQTRIGTGAVKQGDGSLFPFDAVYGLSDKWRITGPVVQGMMRLFLAPAGYDDPLLPFRAMTGVAAIVYLLGMYALLYGQTRSWSVSVFVAVMSTAVMEILPLLLWGFGALEATDPAGLCLALLPVIVIGYLRYETSWGVVGVFAVVGLLANVHLATAADIVLVLGGAYLIRGRFSLKTLGMTLLCGLAAVATALPYLTYLFALRASMATGEPSVYRAAREALKIAQIRIFYSEMPKSLLEWRLLAAVAVMGISGLLVLIRVERYRVRHSQVWVRMIVMALFVGFGLHGASQLVGKWTNTAPPVLSLVEAIRLVILPLFVLLAQGLTNMFRLVRYRHVLRWICVAGALVWMLPSPNLRVARHAGLDVAERFVDVRERPANLRRIRDRADKKAELASIARWARRNTSADAVFLTEDLAFRMLSWRSILVSPYDLPSVYLLAPQELGRWLEDVRAQAALFAPPAGRGNAQEIASFVAGLTKRPEYASAGDWYILLDKKVAFDSLGPLIPVSELDRLRWYQLYRVGLPELSSDAATDQP